MYVVSGYEDPAGIATWQTSPDWASNWTTWRLQPDPFKRLRIMKTILSVAPGFAAAIAGEYHFRGTREGVVRFDRVYSSYWDFVKACDEHIIHPDGSERFIWHYAPPMLLENSKGAFVDLVSPAPLGVSAFLTCKCISEGE